MCYPIQRTVAVLFTLSENNIFFCAMLVVSKRFVEAKFQTFSQSFVSGYLTSKK